MSIRDTEMTATHILVISDGNKGHLKLSLAVAATIEKTLAVDRGSGGEQCHTKVVSVEFKHAILKSILKVVNRHIPGRFPCKLDFVRGCLAKHSYETFSRSRSDIIISCGSAVSGVNSLLKKMRPGAAGIVVLNPGVATWQDYDLLIIPKHDLKDASIPPNVLPTSLIPTRISPEYLKELRTRNWPERRKEGPVIGLLLGGDNSYYKFTEANAVSLAKCIAEICSNFNAELFGTTSRRTPPQAESILKETLAGSAVRSRLVIGREDTCPLTVEKILSMSDVVLASGESISMVSEAVASGRPVVVFMLDKKKPFPNKYERFLRDLALGEAIVLARMEQLSAMTMDILSRVNQGGRRLPNDPAMLAARLRRLLESEPV